MPILPSVPETALIVNTSRLSLNPLPTGSIDPLWGDLHHLLLFTVILLYCNFTCSNRKKYIYDIIIIYTFSPPPTESFKLGYFRLNYEKVSPAEFGHCRYRSRRIRAIAVVIALRKLVFVVGGRGALNVVISWKFYF